LVDHKTHVAKPDSLFLKWFIAYRLIICLLWFLTAITTTLHYLVYVLLYWQATHSIHIYISNYVYKL